MALRDSLISEFSDVFSDELKAGTITGEPMKIKLSSQKDIVKPLKVYRATQTPVHLRTHGCEAQVRLAPGRNHPQC